jgi:hypothetical protein
MQSRQALGNHPTLGSAPQHELDRAIYNHQDRNGAEYRPFRICWYAMHHYLLPLRIRSSSAYNLAVESSNPLFHLRKASPVSARSMTQIEPGSTNVGLFRQ